MEKVILGLKVANFSADGVQQSLKITGFFSQIATNSHI